MLASSHSLAGVELIGEAGAALEAATKQHTIQRTLGYFVRPVHRSFGEPEHLARRRSMITDDRT